MYRILITDEISTIPSIDHRDGIHEWIMNHPEYQVYHTLVNNRQHGGYEIMREEIKVGEVYSPFTYHWSTTFFAPDGKRYGLINEKFEGNHPGIRAFNALSYHEKSWGRKEMYNTGDYVWVDINGHKFTYKAADITPRGIVKSVKHSLDLSWIKEFRVEWDDNKRVYIK